ncbi:hypothetical protein [Mycoplasmopsis gallinacea]|uniref:Uncharacterized protein n=1 Tax=Mycoplasmopsis gallinacea TaxID=29556 RepID=A0A6H0V3G7_9BACT|nr:hypothetical protein [Mycoplasmopsis gallinacea]QIW62528.1 hypothetical protein GOQ20_03860 [Mycoplasmopsis gallinacea]
MLKQSKTLLCGWLLYEWQYFFKSGNFLYRPDDYENGRHFTFCSVACMYLFIEEEKKQNPKALEIIKDWKIKSARDFDLIDYLVAKNSKIDFAHVIDNDQWIEIGEEYEDK